MHSLALRLIGLATIIGSVLVAASTTNTTPSLLLTNGGVSGPDPLEQSSEDAGSVTDHSLDQKPVSVSTQGPIAESGEQLLGLTTCSIDQSNKNECIRNLFNALLPKLKTGGLPEYGLASIDPYFYQRGIFRYTSEGLQGGLLIKNMQIHGISRMQLKSFAANITGDDIIAKLSFEIKPLMAHGEFKADVKFGGLRLVPKGPFNITIESLRATLATDGRFFNAPEKDKGKRLKLQRLNANVSIGKARIVADGIFTDQNLNAMILNLVNENLPEIARIGIPATKEQWAPMLVEHINKYFAQVPIEKFIHF